MSLHCCVLGARYSRCGTSSYENLESVCRGGDGSGVVIADWYVGSVPSRGIFDDDSKAVE